MTVGWAQSLLKTSALLPGADTVLAGSGPLLWYFASQMLRLGVRPQAIVDTTPRGRIAAAAAFMPAFLASSYGLKGMALLARVYRRVPVYRYAARLQIARGERLTLRFTQQGKVRRLDTSTLLLHQGVIPATNLVSLAGCKLQWDQQKALWRPETDPWGQSSVPTIGIAGDGADILGARAAEAMGRLAAFGAMRALEAISAAVLEKLAIAARRDLDRALRGRRFIDAVYTPSVAARCGEPGAIVCRCENVLGAQIIDAADRLAVIGPNQVKAFLRCGMGPCQGRMCATTVTDLIARTQHCSPNDIGLLRIRPPLRPMTVGALAKIRLPETPAKPGHLPAAGSPPISASAQDGHRPAR